MKLACIESMSFLKKVSKCLLIVFVISIVVPSCSSGSDDVVFVTPDPEPTPEPTPTPDPNALTAKEITAAMSAGFNLGNTFENGNNTCTLASVKPIIDLYAGAGMKHVRIPTTWMDRFTASDHLADDNGTLNTNNTRFIELVKVIDYAISKDLYVVLNTHHEHWLKDNYDGSAAFDTKFSNLWTGIATYFKDYSQHLIFEVLNEPEGNLGEWDGNGPFPDPTSSTALSYVRKVNKVGYDAIRAAGGNNATRLIMVSTNAQGNEVMIEEVYPNKASLPGGGTDKYLAIQVHSYNPWSFCGQTGSNSAFPGTASIETAIKKVGTHSRLLDVPVNYGEFGVGRDGSAASPSSERNTDLVRGYYKTYDDTTISQQMSYSVWDDRGWFGLINSAGTTFTNNIVPYMLQ
ncbi:glycoside hydrolase family 5 protein [Yeosuana marina]|uniref:glycoside hydrolase family 5 protein n=1 Tax=Yeosuana marina TaxID=1565536 RepID=UPI0030C7FD69